MDYANTILLGIIQGVTEFLPVSSSGHLILAPVVFGFKDQGLVMDVILHLATLLSIIMFFRQDLTNIVKAIISPNGDPAYKKLGWSLLIATIPAGIVGLVFESWIESNLRSSTFVACNLIFWSLVFWIADKKVTKTPTSDVREMSFAQIFFIGCAQAVALLPGTSRSGITIAAGLFGNLSREAAARFSFLLGTPIILAAGAHKSLSIFTVPGIQLDVGLGELATGFLITFAVGYLSIKILLDVVKRLGLLPFIIYRILLAALILIYY